MVHRFERMTPYMGNQPRGKKDSVAKVPLFILIRSYMKTYRVKHQAPIQFTMNQMMSTLNKKNSSPFFMNERDPRLDYKSQNKKKLKREERLSRLPLTK